MDNPVQITLGQQHDFQFAVHFDNPLIPVLLTDEPAPLGGGHGPNPEQMLATAVANCLSASLLFAMRKFKNDPSPIRTLAAIGTARNTQNRIRISAISVDITIGVPAANITMLERILGQFEDFCVVTQSVRTAIPVTVRVLDSEGNLLHTSVA